MKEKRKRLQAEEEKLKKLEKQQKSRGRKDTAAARAAQAQPTWDSDSNESHSNYTCVLHSSIPPSIYLYRYIPSDFCLAQGFSVYCIAAAFLWKWVLLSASSVPLTGKRKTFIYGVYKRGSER